jgi:hypothetical protein
MTKHDDREMHWIAREVRDLAVRAFQCVRLNDDPHTREPLAERISLFELRLEDYANAHRIPLSELRRWASNLRRELVRSAVGTGSFRRESRLLRPNRWTSLSMPRVLKPCQTNRTTTSQKS